MDLTNVPERCKPGLLAMNGDTALAQLDGPQVIVNRYLGGESIIHIAEALGCHHSAIYRFLWRVIPDEWPHIRAARAEAQYDEAVERLAGRDAIDGCEIGRAREVARFRFGELAALRREFSTKQEVRADAGAGGSLITITVAGEPVADTLTGENTGRIG